MNKLSDKLLRKELEASIKGAPDTQSAPDNVYIENMLVRNEYIISMMYHGVLMFLRSTTKSALRISQDIKQAVRFHDLSACKVMRDDALDPAYHYENVKILRIS